MYTKMKIQSALSHLKEYSVTNGEGTGYEELFAPLLSLVDAYFAKDKALEKKINYTLHQLALDIQNRRTVYEHQELLPELPSEAGAPQGYKTVKILFNGGGAFDEITQCNAANFLASFVSETSEGGESSGAMQVTSNPYLDKWEEQLTVARAGELSDLQAVADFCESGSYAGGLAMLFEDLGQVIKSVGRDRLANEMYIKRGYKEVIEAFGLGVYVPTIMR